MAVWAPSGATSTHRAALDRIQNDLEVGGSHFLPEMVIAGLKHKLKIIEVPVNYLPRVGTSSVTGRPLAAVAVGLRMILLILEYRLRAFFPGGRFARSRRFRERNNNGDRERAVAG